MKRTRISKYYRVDWFKFRQQKVMIPARVMKHGTLDQKVSPRGGDELFGAIVRLFHRFCVVF